MMLNVVHFDAPMRAKNPLPARRSGRRSSARVVWCDVAGSYKDVSDFRKAATLAENQGHDFVLTSGRYVGAEDVVKDGEPVDAKMERMVAALRAQQAEGQRLDVLNGQALGGLGL